jgi:hypothetical protein
MRMKEGRSWLSVAMIAVLLLSPGAASSVWGQTIQATGRGATSVGQPRLAESDAVRLASTTALSQPSGRESDSVLNGALIGAGVAVATGLFLCTRTEPWENCRDDVGPMLRIGAIGAGIGIAIDALIRRKVPAATSLHAAPILARETRGVRISISF